MLLVAKWSSCSSPVQLAFEKKVAAERLAAAEKERKELVKTNHVLEASLKAEFEGRLAKALAEADRAFTEEREKLRYVVQVPSVMATILAQAGAGRKRKAYSLCGTCRVTIESEYKAKFSDTLAAIDSDARLMEELTAKNEELQQKLIQKQRELRDAEKDAKQLAAVNKQVRLCSKSPACAAGFKANLDGYRCRWKSYRCGSSRSKGTTTTWSRLATRSSRPSAPSSPTRPSGTECCSTRSSSWTRVCGVQLPPVTRARAPSGHVLGSRVRRDCVLLASP